MRLTILAVGSRGDVQPYLALALGLSHAGHRVRLATHETFRDLVEERGVDFFALAGDPRGLVEEQLGQAWLQTGRNPVAFWRALAPIVRRFFDSSVAREWEACQGAEAVVYSALGLMGYHIAERLGIPSIAAYLQPVSATRAFPTPIAPPSRRLPGALNLLTHRVAAQGFWQLYRPHVNRWRQEHGLPKVPMTDPFRRLQRERYPMLYAYSPAVLSKPPDWPAWLHVTGYWFLDPPPGWRPAPELEAFLDAGAPPVCVGFGSMRPRDPVAFGATVLAAVQRAGQRAAVQAGWAGLRGLDGSDDVLAVEDVPHSWLFARARAVVCHGGAGTTGAAVRSGHPTVVAPFFGDQFFWADRIARLGVGPRPVPARELTADALAAAITAATSDPGMTARAGALGERVCAEDGVGRAVEVVEAHVGAIESGRRG